MLNFIKMRSLILLFVILFYIVKAKETAVYTVEGAQLINLLRGRIPEDGRLPLTKVETKDINQLPDGIYYQPAEDTDYSVVKEEPKYLSVKVILNFIFK